MTTPSAAAIAAANPFGLGPRVRPSSPAEDEPPPAAGESRVTSTPKKAARPAIAWALGVRGSILFKVGRHVYTIDADTVAAAMSTKESA